jgi:hypothetical protein
MCIVIAAYSLLFSIGHVHFKTIQEAEHFLNSVKGEIFCGPNSVSFRFMRAKEKSNVYAGDPRVSNCIF